MDKKEFYHDAQDDIRKELGLKKDDKILLYTGRMSLMKRSVEMVTLFLKLLQDKKIPENTYLLMVGEFDSLGFSFGDEFHHEGEY